MARQLKFYVLESTTEHAKGKLVGLMLESKNEDGSKFCTDFRDAFLRGRAYLLITENLLSFVSAGEAAPDQESFSVSLQEAAEIGSAGFADPGRITVLYGASCRDRGAALHILLSTGGLDGGWLPRTREPISV